MAASATELQRKYEINPEVLGSGNFGKVFLAHNNLHPDHKVAIKTIPKHKLGDAISLIREEIRILQLLDHPNIIKYFETYESQKYMYLVMEYCGGGELFERITAKKEGGFSEENASKLMYKLFHAINHCHSNNIAHRDLKPENIMYSDKGEEAEIKLIDFGLSK
jgi:calcium-dependent protein kinase